MISGCLSGVATTRITWRFWKIFRTSRPIFVSSRPSGSEEIKHTRYGAMILNEETLNGRHVGDVPPTPCDDPLLFLLRTFPRSNALSSGNWLLSSLKLSLEYVPASSQREQEKANMHAYAIIAQLFLVARSPSPFDHEPDQLAWM